MDVDYFISLLEERPPLWRKQDRDFSNRDVRRELFEEVSQATGASVDQCQKKLKVLKDTMRKCIQRLPRTKSGQPVYTEASVNTITWPHFDAMLFMKEEFIAKATIDRTEEESWEEERDEAEHDQEPQDNGSEISAVSDSFSAASAELFSTRAPKKRRINGGSKAVVKHARQASLKEEILKLELAKVQNLSAMLEREKDKDGLDLFMADIVCDLRNISDPFLKLDAKSKIRRVVEDAMLKQLQLNSSGQVSGGSGPKTHVTIIKGIPSEVSADTSS